MALIHSRPRLRQQDLADRLGVKKAWFSNVKKGRWKGDEELRRAAEILGVPAEWLVSGQGPEPSWATAPAPSPAPPWAAELLAEVRALRAELAAIGAPVLGTGHPADLPPAVAALQRQMRRARTTHAPDPAPSPPQHAGAGPATGA